HAAGQRVGSVGLLLEDCIADRTWTANVVLLGHGPEVTASRKDSALEVGHPALAKRPNATDPAGQGQGWADDLVREDLRRGVDSCHVQLLLGAEMGEQAALAHAEVAREALQGDSLQALGRADLGGMEQDR